MYKSLLLISNHGMGKSSMVFQAAKRREELFGYKCPVIDQRLSQKDVGDMTGLPHQVNGRTYFAPPDWFPLHQDDQEKLKELFMITEQVIDGEHGEHGYLFLDELDRASKPVKAAVFEIVLDRSLHGRKIPDGWRVIAAINGSASFYGNDVMETALLSRFAVIDFKPTFEEWWAYCAEIGVHDSIIEFTKFNDKFIDPTDEYLEEHAGEKLYDRRSWVHLSDAIAEFETAKGKGHIPYSILDKNSEAQAFALGVIASYIGSDAGRAYHDFVRTQYKGLTAEMIVDDWDESTKKKIKRLVVDSDRVVELGHYNEQVVELIKKRGENLTKKQVKNLFEYMTSLNRELSVSFWKHFNKEAREISLAWYNDTKYGEKIAEHMLSQLEEVN
jgi:hypothetical protein